MAVTCSTQHSPGCSHALCAALPRLSISSSLLSQFKQSCALSHIFLLICRFWLKEQVFCLRIMVTQVKGSQGYPAAYQVPYQIAVFHHYCRRYLLLQCFSSVSTSLRSLEVMQLSVQPPALLAQCPHQVSFPCNTGQKAALRGQRTGFSAVRAAMDEQTPTQFKPLKY